MGKVSKKDQDAHQTDKDRTALEVFLSKKSQHFEVGTFILSGGKRGEILAELRCKCPKSETALRIRWDDGSMSIIEPIALNR